jgi:hypothetical protein
MEEAKPVAVEAYKVVLEDGPEICSSEISGDYSDDDEELEKCMHQYVYP